jgi:hypothetical protein
VADSYSGPIKILGGDGIFLTTGVASLEDDNETASWKGLVQMLSGTGVAGKALVVELETPEGGRGRAQLTPHATVGDRSTSVVTGLGDKPY